MSVSAVSHAGDGATRSFAIPFYHANPDELVVWIEQTAGAPPGRRHLFRRTNDFTCAGAGAATGTLTLANGPTPQTGEVLRIQRMPTSAARRRPQEELDEANRIWWLVGDHLMALSDAFSHRVEVADLQAPVELAALSGAIDGETALVYERPGGGLHALAGAFGYPAVLAAANFYGVYAWTTGAAIAADSPRIVPDTANTGAWSLVEGLGNVAAPLWQKTGFVYARGVNLAGTFISVREQSPAAPVGAFGDLGNYWFGDGFTYANLCGLTGSAGSTGNADSGQVSFTTTAPPALRGPEHSAGGQAVAAAQRENQETEGGLGYGPGSAVATVRPAALQGQKTRKTASNFGGGGARMLWDGAAAGAATDGLVVAPKAGALHEVVACPAGTPGHESWIGAVHLDTFLAAPTAGQPLWVMDAGIVRVQVSPLKPAVVGDYVYASFATPGQADFIAAPPVFAAGLGSATSFMGICVGAAAVGGLAEVMLR